ncbi:glycosyltransferase family 2 protein [Phaeobacter sp.]|uniref:glycosyltransferase family 2 protein n=1 Tax=Phaeobacter sp. TaxID=1902409 RepID=UPI0025E4E5F7|nr:glycosyltransferase family A protein [Phaeobacter sp.]
MSAAPSPSPSATAKARIEAVVIGRNEGTRLLACLDSLRDQVDRIIYVDSGSTDGSVAAAKARGATVINLDTEIKFTAARARNAGLAAISDRCDFVQFVDGDCTVVDNWVAAAVGHLQSDPTCAVVCGRRRERHPDASVYNRLCDWEWDTPIGPTRACGGDALMRATALRQVGGYRDELIAGEEPELCLRLARNGWSLYRADLEMTLHDAQMLRFGQWWQRSRRAGFAFAEGAALHGSGPERHWVAETRRALIWGAGIPAVLMLVAATAGPGAALGAAIYPLQFLRLCRKMPAEVALFSVIGKFPEALGVIEARWLRLRGQSRGLLEYK